MTDTARLTELEIRIAYLEDALSTLDSIVTRQADQMDELRKAHRLLIERLRALEERVDEAGRPPGESPPPHY